MQIMRVCILATLPFCRCRNARARDRVWRESHGEIHARGADVASVAMQKSEWRMDRLICQSVPSIFSRSDFFSLILLGSLSIVCRGFFRGIGGRNSFL